MSSCSGWGSVKAAPALHTGTHVQYLFHNKYINLSQRFLRTGRILPNTDTSELLFSSVSVFEGLSWAPSVLPCGPHVI